ncbi:MAG: hypothetical protein AMXMBFR13_47740 [Phycisphaerae bacterium]
MIQEPVDTQIHRQRTHRTGQASKVSPRNQDGQGEQPDQKIHLSNRSECLKAGQRPGLGAVKRVDEQHNRPEAQDACQVRRVDGVFREPGREQEQPDGHDASGGQGHQPGESQNPTCPLGIALTELGDVLRGGKSEAKAGEDAEHTHRRLDHAQFAVGGLTEHARYQNRGGQHHAAGNDRPRHRPERAFEQPVTSFRRFDTGKNGA